VDISLAAFVKLRARCAGAGLFTSANPRPMPWFITVAVANGLNLAPNGSCSMTGRTPVASSSVRN